LAKEKERSKFRSKVRMKYFLLSVLLLAGCGQNDPGLAKKVSITKDQRAAIEERIKPFSVVMVDGVTAVMPVAALPGEAKYAACGACHGANGGGGVGPALAGQTVEYIVGRLNQYKAGEKVGNQSNLMWGQAAGLSDQDMNDLAEYIATL
jgi:cytochrome c553